MENTPLELYERAYKLHYEEKRIPEAIVYYKKLINEFPESNECGYAVIQLQKIKANEVAGSIKDFLEEPKRSSNILPFFMFSLILFLLYTVTLFWVVRNFSEKIKIEQKRTQLIFSSLGKLIRKDHTGVQEILAELKKISPEDITPYELSAYVYRLQKKEEESINEYSTFFALNPDKKPSENELKYLRKREEIPSLKEKDNIKTQTAVDTPPPKVRKQEIEESRDNLPPQTSTSKRSQPSLKPKQESPPAPPPPEKGKKKKGLLLVDPDSISYF
ncbi:MAG: hypothetical protein N2053_11260 [Chitinispirillaceae bacterium]|nr:hypothetical protein [Chitinispirillaceae bacterium]